MEPRLFDLDIQLLADTFLTIIAVFVLFLIMSYFLFNPARKFMQARQDRIAGELENARTTEEEAARLKEEYEAKLANVEAEADEILTKARKKAMDNENRIVALAKEEAARIIARANVEAELEKKKVADEVKKEMISLAAVMAGRIAAASMDEEKQNALIEETLSEIGEGTWLN
ncbi:MAG: F0F1 ATP synthase subunit B [Lachnospiraceae bacterium]|nr:F0F1 ATP synthase subunit B [Lachnospiraceae bacterium]